MNSVASAFSMYFSMGVIFGPAKRVQSWRNSARQNVMVCNGQKWPLDVY